MKKINFTFPGKVKGFTALLILIMIPCLNAQTAPDWVINPERSYPGREWVAVTAQGTSQHQAESSAMNALARVFKTDVAGITQSSQQFSQIIRNSTGSKNINFEESSSFLQEVDVSSNIKGLIGVQIDVYRDTRGTVFICARMNRRECAARYSGMVRENTAIIDNLLASAAPIAISDSRQSTASAASNEVFRSSLENYARLSLAYALAQVTDNFQNILEVLDSSAANRRPSYGGASSIKAKMLECASLITIGITVVTEQEANQTLFIRAAGSFFKNHGFKTNDNGTGDYVLRVNVRFEDVIQNVISCRYFIDASLENRSGTSVFSFTEDDRAAHRNSQSEARRLAVRAVETSIKEAKFAKEFNQWLNMY